MAHELRRSESYFVGFTFSVWSAYWEGRGEKQPPLHFYRVGAGEDLFFITGEGNESVKQFISSQKSNPEVKFRSEGDWVLDPTTWLGHWSVFTVTPRQAFSNLVRSVLN